MQAAGCPAKSSELEKTLPDGATDCARAIGGAELRDNGGDVKLHRLVADGKTIGDRLVRQTVGQQLQHFGFTSG